MLPRHSIKKLELTQKRIELEKGITEYISSELGTALEKFIQYHRIQTIQLTDDQFGTKVADMQ